MRFPISPAEQNRIEQRAVASIATYESIKAKIDRGVNRQLEGDKEVSEGLKEMIATKAYLKHYKNIAAFAEAEYGKSRDWVYDRVKSHIPNADQESTQTIAVLTKTVAPSDGVAYLPSKPESQFLINIQSSAEAEKPTVHSADEESQPNLNNNGHDTQAKPKENGKPKCFLAIWKELEESLFGRALNRLDELNRQCPNPKLHAQLIAQAKCCIDLIEKWRDSIK